MENSTKKITKREKYGMISAILEAAENMGIEIDSETITYEALNEFIANEVQLLDKKTEAAAARSAAKKAEGDALQTLVYDTLSDSDYMTIAEIVEAIGDPDVTSSMVTARLTKLGEKVEKEQRSVPTSDGKARKLSAYRKVA